MSKWGFEKKRGDRQSDTRQRGGNPKRYKAKSVVALQVALGGLPDAMHVEADHDIGVTAKTVGELRRVTVWSENLVITTPQERGSASAIRVSKASHAARVMPKS
ncbi:MAG TPA: hypothetical protein VEK31_04290 [Xanthobacteraceae bacterium]|nr:hypothetical protein [Xanthobacteraceae bacterium]